MKRLAVAGKTNQQFTELRSYPEVAPKITFVFFALIRHPGSLRGGHLGPPRGPPTEGRVTSELLGPSFRRWRWGNSTGGGAVYDLFKVKEKVKKLAQMMGTVIQSIPILNTV